jgi:hypothetical protein
MSERRFLPGPATSGSPRSTDIVRSPDMSQRCHERTQAGYIDTRYGFVAGRDVPVGHHISLGHGASEQPYGAANSDIPQPRNARAALLSSMSTLARERPWISLALMRRQLRHITVSSSPQRAAALDSRLAPAGCACLIELPVVQADQLLRRLIGLDGARLDPRLERPLERKRRV